MGMSLIEEDVKKCQSYTDRIMEVLNPVSVRDIPVIAISLKSIHKTIVRDMPPEQKILYALMQEAISCTILTTTIKEERL